MLAWMKHRVESSWLGKHADDATLLAENEEELKSLLMWVKEEGENAGLKLSIKKTKIMASSPITSWQIEGEKVEAVTDFFFLGLQKSLRMLTAAIKLKMWASWKESYDKGRQSIKKQKHHFVSKSLYSQSYVFSSSHGWM